MPDPAPATAPPAPAVPPTPHAAAVLDAVHALAAQLLPASPGPDVRALAAATGLLQIELARRLDAWSVQDAATAPIAVCADHGLSPTQARLWRRAAAFARQQPALEPLWRAGAVTSAQLAAVEKATARLAPAARAEVVAALAPALPGMSLADTETAAEAATDIADPRDPDHRERSDYEHRSLRWTGVAGGMDFRGYLPRTEAEALIAAVNAVAEQQRSEGDGRSLAQRRADGLAGVVAIAASHGLPTGGGLPAAVTLTISAAEASRLAAQDPARCGPAPERTTPPAATGSGASVGDGAARFALCCAPITPIHHHDHPQPGSLLQRISHGTALPLDVGRAVRLATAAQRKALLLRDGGCTVPGCDIPAAYTQPHHITPWSLGGATDLSNLCSLCWAHHRQVELGLIIIEASPPGGPTHFTITRRAA